MEQGQWKLQQLLELILFASGTYNVGTGAAASVSDDLSSNAGDRLKDNSGPFIVVHE